MLEILNQAYPDAECVADNADIDSRLSEELRMFPTEAEFHLNIKGLYELHGHTRFANMVTDFAHASSWLYAELAEDSGQAPILEDMFSAGSVFGPHLSTMNLPPSQVIGIHMSSDPDIDGLSYDNSNATTKTDIMHVLGEIADSHGAQLESNGAQLVDAAAGLYSYTGDETERYFFALGYRFAVDSVAKFGSYYEDVPETPHVVNLPV